MLTILAPIPMIEYKLSIQPDEDIIHQVQLEQKLFAQQFGSCAHFDKPEIVLATFQAREELEPTLLRWLQNIAHLQPFFVVALNNFNGLPYHTIYVRVMDKMPFQNLLVRLSALEEFMQSNACPPMHFCFTPLLAIASELPKPVYEQSVAEYTSRNFTASFPVNTLLLWKKEKAEQSFRLFSQFHLQMPANFFAA
jgi:hypothetical protein